MKKDQIEVGATYVAKVGTRSVEVRIERENPKGGWDASSVASGKPIRVKDAARLRHAKAVDGGGAVVGGTEPETTAADADLAPLTREGKGRKRAARAGAKPKGSAEPKPRSAKASGAAKEGAPKRTSCLDAAAAVLKAAGEPMRCKEMVAAMRDKGLWTSTAPTPEATLYSAILREIGSKGDESRFKKTGPGRFGLNA